MGLRESWSGLGTGMQILVGLAVGGVVLVVGLVILVILAAVIASFVLGLGSETTPDGPQASFEFDYDSESMTMEITHDGGDSIAADRLIVSVDDKRTRWGNSGDEVTVGDSTVVEVQPGDEVREGWFNGEDMTRTLSADDVPE